MAAGSQGCSWLYLFNIFCKRFLMGENWKKKKPSGETIIDSEKSKQSWRRWRIIHHAEGFLTMEALGRIPVYIRRACPHPRTWWSVPLFTLKWKNCQNASLPCSSPLLYLLSVLLPLISPPWKSKANCFNQSSLNVDICLHCNYLTWGFLRNWSGWNRPHELIGLAFRLLHYTAR